MTQQEINMVAEVILAHMAEMLPGVVEQVMKKNEDLDRVVGMKEATVILNRSETWIKRHLDEIPHYKAKKYANTDFIKRELIEYRKHNLVRK